MKTITKGTPFKKFRCPLCNEVYWSTTYKQLEDRPNATNSDNTKRLLEHVELSCKVANAQVKEADHE